VTLSERAHSHDCVTVSPKSRTATRVILLTPSRGLGGGIERYVETLECVLNQKGLTNERVDLTRPGIRAHARILTEVRGLLRMTTEATRLVVCHRTLLPVAMLLSREPTVSGVSVLCHGAEVWHPRIRLRSLIERRLLSRPCVRVVAVSSFTAGTLGHQCQATILPPALSKQWFDTLVTAAAARKPAAGVRILTTFRLASWHEKGLPQLVAAVAALGRDDVKLTICGSGDPPAELLRLVSAYAWCALRPRLTDDELAYELAAADLFVLATRTRLGRRASGEGFGLALLEAQVAGTPVIVPAYGGCSDAYVEGVTGVAPTDETTVTLSRAIGEMLNDQSRLEMMGERAAQWARESFAPERYVDLAVKRLI
jgi:phosphatidylinositol alpha-1,6-mannosyltransferase